MDHLHGRQFLVHAPEAQIHDGRGGLHANVLQERVGLLDLRGQRVSVVRVTGEAARAHHQAVLVRDRQADLDAELVGLASLPLPDALSFWCVQRIQLVLVLGPLLVDALGALHPGVQLQLGAMGQAIHLAPNLPQQSAQDRALALEHAAQALELLGVGVATGLATQRLALALVGLLELDTSTLGQPGDLLAGDFQQPAVGGVGDGLALNRGVDDDALELGLLHGAHVHGSLDGGLEQLLHAGFAKHPAESTDLRRIARQTWLEIDLAAEELEVHVLRPALDQGLIALVVGVLQIQQRHHQANGQTRPPRVAADGARNGQRRAEQVCAVHHPARAITV